MMSSIIFRISGQVLPPVSSMRMMVLSSALASPSVVGMRSKGPVLGGDFLGPFGWRVVIVAVRVSAILALLLRVIGTGVSPW